MSKCYTTLCFHVQLYLKKSQSIRQSFAVTKQASLSRWQRLGSPVGPQWRLVCSRPMWVKKRPRNWYSTFLRRPHAENPNWQPILRSSSRFQPARYDAHLPERNVNVPARMHDSPSVLSVSLDRKAIMQDTIRTGGRAGISRDNKHTGATLDARLVSSPSQGERHGNSSCGEGVWEKGKRPRSAVFPSSPLRWGKRSWAVQPRLTAQRTPVDAFVATPLYVAVLPMITSRLPFLFLRG